MICSYQFLNYNDSKLLFENALSIHDIYIIDNDICITFTYEIICSKSCSLEQKGYVAKLQVSIVRWICEVDM